jgi:K+-sensing histidine kinase KdpD
MNMRVPGETVLFRSDYWLQLNPWSRQALLVALTGVAMAVGIRTALDSCGVDLYFAPFVPAILLASLIAGVPAGCFTALSAVVIVWWAFIPPVFEFSPLTPDDIDRFQLFLLAVSVLIWFAHLCRMIARMRAQ